MPTPWKKERTWIFSPWNCDKVLLCNDYLCQFSCKIREFGKKKKGRPACDALEHDDGDCVVEDRFAKDDRVQFRVDVELVKDGEDRDRVGGRQGRAEQEALDDGEREAFEAEERVEVYDDAGQRGMVSKSAGGAAFPEKLNRPPHPRATAEMKVPAKANVRMTWKCRKKCSCLSW